MGCGANQNGLISYCLGKEFTLQSVLRDQLAGFPGKIRSPKNNLWRFSVFLREFSRNVFISYVAGLFGEQPSQALPAKVEIFQSY